MCLEKEIALANKTVKRKDAAAQFSRTTRRSSAGSARATLHLLLV